MLRSFPENPQFRPNILGQQASINHKRQCLNPNSRSREVAMHKDSKMTAMLSLVVCGAVLTNGCDSLSPTDYTGTYRGTTASGQSISMEVAGDQISIIEVRADSLSVGNCTMRDFDFTFTWTTITKSGIEEASTFPISGDKFSVSTELNVEALRFDFEIEGRFVSRDSVQGSITIKGEDGGPCEGGLFAETFTLNRGP